MFFFSHPPYTSRGIFWIIKPYLGNHFSWNSTNWCSYFLCAGKTIFPRCFSSFSFGRSIVRILRGNYTAESHNFPNRTYLYCCYFATRLWASRMWKEIKGVLFLLLVRKLGYIKSCKLFFPTARKWIWNMMFSFYLSGRHNKKKYRVDINNSDRPENVLFFNINFVNMNE